MHLGATWLRPSPFVVPPNCGNSPRMKEMQVSPYTVDTQRKCDEYSSVRSHKRLKADTSSDKRCIDARWSAPHTAINSHQDPQSRDHGAFRESGERDPGERGGTWK